MNKMFIVLGLLLAVASAEKWALFLSANTAWGNYCITSTICPVRNGIPRDHIVYFSFDGNFDNDRNPYPGQMFSESSESGLPEDYAPECRAYIDYTGDNITPETFMAALSGDADTMKKLTEDTIFVYYMDHGGPGSCEVGHAQLKATVLMDTIQKMYNAKKYKKLVFYFEACYSGSMFTDLPQGLNVYAFTGADDKHSAWMSFCPPNDVINGKNLHTCISAYYDDEWENIVEKNGTAITHNDVFKIAHDNVALKTDQNISQYGDIDTIGNELLSEVFGSTMTLAVPDVPLHLAKWKAIRSNKNSNDDAMKELEQVILQDLKKEISVSRLVSRSVGEKKVESAMKYSGRGDHYCVNELASQLTSKCGYSLPFREEHVNALHYICTYSNLRTSLKLFSEVC
ncbi:hypothetical protein WA158_002678 [Blastocystis sp. Blastoise]